MNLAEELYILEGREEQKTKELEEIREMRKDAIKRLEMQLNNRALTRKEVAELLQYNYSWMSTLNIPFNGRKIMYLDLLEWVKKNKSHKREVLEKNFEKLRRSI